MLPLAWLFGNPAAPGLVARVGVDYPAEWLSTFARKGFDVRGVRVLSHPVDLRSFIAYSEQSIRIEADPAAFLHPTRSAISKNPAELPNSVHKPG